jgi:cation diffusion facilitator CzcD-associated flavoprotein CzcO
MMSVACETVIIGGGPAGLAVARCLQEGGREGVVLEQQPQVATMWRDAYERLHLHTPRGRSGLPHQPMPASYPQYPTRQQVIDYLEDYAGALTVPVRLNVRALSVRRADGGWLVGTAGDQFVARNLVIATSRSRVPVVPQFDGLDGFGGTVLHSAQYRSGETFRGQRVLVVGFGNSAAEIAIDLVEQGATPTLSVRGPVNVIPRDILGIPVVSLGIVQRLFSPRLADLINAPVMLLTVGDITRHGLAKLPYGATTQIREHSQVPVLDIGTMALIRSGRIAVRSGIGRFTGEGAVFADGRVEPFDAVVLATGFRPALEDLLGGTDGVLDGDGIPLASGDSTAQPGLYFCGYRVASSGALREIGIEARRIASLVAAGPAVQAS